MLRYGFEQINTGRDTARIAANEDRFKRMVLDKAVCVSVCVYRPSVYDRFSDVVERRKRPGLLDLEVRTAKCFPFLRHAQPKDERNMPRRVRGGAD